MFQKLENGPDRSIGSIYNLNDHNIAKIATRPFEDDDVDEFEDQVVSA